jgi:phosphatidate cytidylyltransferase
MLTRIITGVIGIPLVLVLVFWPGGLPFTVLIGLAIVAGMIEFYRASRRGGFRPNRLLGVVAAGLTIYLAREISPQTLLIGPVLVGLTILSLSYELLRDNRRPVANVGSTLLGLAYVCWLLQHFILLRGIDGSMTLGPWIADRGAWLVMFALFCTWALDTGAYFVGKFYGRKKLAPAISPNKTVEGSVAGFACSLIVGAVLGALLHIPQPHGLILGALIGIIGQIGDLAGSAIKREVGIKDFSSLLPGHGGVLDRVDSLLFVGPVVFYYVRFLL